MQTPGQDRSTKAVATWLYIGVFMLMIQVILGGITRLTGSGLSITEWNVVQGTMPPLTESSWLLEFEKYKATPQFRLLNMDFTLSDYKFIYFWEWLHRLWGRFIGVVFIAGFIYLVARKHLRKDMYGPVLILLPLGALLGGVGWIMVKSGLSGDAIYVRPTKLALHFVYAIGVISYTFWFALHLSVPVTQRVSIPKIKNRVLAILVVLFFQLIYGALMAGHKAATAAPTWPDINGHFVPPTILRESPVMLNFVENTQAIHFIHRLLAYILLVLIIELTIKIWRTKGATRYLNKAAIFPLIFVFVQALLGIISVIISPGIIPGKWAAFEWIAQFHQITGMLLVLSLIATWYLTSGKSFKQSL